MKTENTTWHTATIDRQARQQKNGHRSAIVWFTGLPPPITTQATPLWASRLWALALSTQFLVLSTWLLYLPTYGPGAEC